MRGKGEGKGKGKKERKETVKGMINRIGRGKLIARTRK